MLADGQEPCDKRPMRSAPALTVALLLAACNQSAERVRVAPAIAVVGTEAAVPTRNPLVGGVVLPVDRTLATDIAAVPTLSMLNRAVVAAGLAATLGGPGPVTLFAPTDEAFGRLAPGTVDALLKPENRASLAKLLNLHTVPGRLTSAELIRRVTAGGGRATLTSTAGETLTVTMTGNIVTLTDAGGNRSYLETADVRGSNGIMHVVNGVLVPRLP